MTSEAIVYLLRKTSLTREEIGHLSPAQFGELIKEVSYQEAVETYQQQHQLASLLAAIYNTIPRKRGSKVFKAEDFLVSDPPQRNLKADSLDEIANERGIRLPSKELKNRSR